VLRSLLIDNNRSKNILDMQTNERRFTSPRGRHPLTKGVAESGRRAVAGNDGGVGIERVEPLLDRLRDRREVAAGQIGAPDRVLEHRAAGQQQRAVGHFDAESAAPQRVDHFGGRASKR